VTRRKRRRSTFAVRCWQVAGTAVALVVLGFAADGIGWLLIAAAGMVGVR